MSTIKYKGVDWAYPSSTNAVRCGKGKEGCYTVTVYEHDQDGSLKNTTTSTTGYDTMEEAYAAAAKLPEPWGGVWKRYCRHAIAKAEGVQPDDIYKRTDKDPRYVL